jgi:L-serine kinase (ATP) / ParB family transcriptional regulator, heme-responsive regulator
MTDLPTRTFALPDLRIVPVDCLIPHERHDEHRMGPLTARLKSQAVLRNPPVVTPLPIPGQERYVVLDGANRSEAAREIALPHFAVQVVRYEEPDVRLLTWNHALAGADARSLFHLLSSVPGISCSRETPAHARAQLARREILAFAASADGAITLSTPGDFSERNRALNRVVEAYRGKTRVYRVGSDSVEAALERIPDAEAIVVFPRYAPAEVLELAATGERVPAGITRHLVSWRALRVNLPLDLLADRDTSREEKQAWLHSWMRERVEAGSVRFYEESTVLFDE